jgi:GntR family transcriptional regulator/MocR family aminotransferase
MGVLAGSAIAGTALDPSSAEPLHRQLYGALREAVLSGHLAPGARLASTRTMASDLGVSRNTVMAAFDQLLAEGYLEGRVGAGTFVTRTLPDHTLRARTRPSAATRERRARGRGLSARGRVLVSSPVPPTRAGPPRPLRVGTPAIDEFPLDAWSRLVTKHWRSGARELLGYGDPAGYRPLREAIAVHLAVARGVRCDPDQVVIVSGSQQALDLTARLLVDDGDRVWIEDPGYMGARASIASSGAKLVPVPVDAEGIDVAEGVRRAPDAAMAYVSPSHQYPVGATMSLARRLALLAWARDAGAWILEDDYDSEFRYAGRPLAALQGLDADGRVIYLGTFSKVMLPSLRIGYMVLPTDIVDAFVTARAVSDRHSPAIEQAALAEFIREGLLERHIRRMRMLYADRQASLLDAARRHLGDAIDLRPAHAGMHLTGFLPDGRDDGALARTALAAGVEVMALSSYAIERRRPGLVLGYACATPAEIRAAVRRLAPVLAAR